MSVINEALRAASQGKKGSAAPRHESVKEAVIGRYQGESVNQKKNGWILLAVSLLLVAALMAVVLLFMARESERKLKVQAEQQLAAKSEEAVKKQTQVDQLVKDKNDMFASAGRLQTSVRFFQGKIETLSAQVDALKKENKSLKDDNAAKARKMEGLSGELRVAELDRLTLSKKLRELEAKTAAGQAQQGGSQ